MKQQAASKKRVNRFTGEKKKWICYDNRRIDELLDCIEVLYQSWRRGDKIGANMSREMLEKLEDIRDMINGRTEKLSGGAWEFPAEFRRN